MKVSIRTASTGLVICDILLNNNVVLIYCDVSTRRPRPLVPDTWQRTVFDTVHGLSHVSIRTIKIEDDCKDVCMARFPETSRHVGKSMAQWLKSASTFHGPRGSVHYSIALHSFLCSDRTRVRSRVTVHFRILVGIVSTSSPSSYSHLCGVDV